MVNAQGRKQKLQAALVSLQASGDRLLTLVLGPETSGKTELLREWTAGQQEAVAWMTLNERDNQPDRFANSLACALQQSGVIPALLPAGKLTRAGDLEVQLIDLLNQVAGSQLKVILVLDSYQHITNPVIHSAVALALDFPPSNLQVIIASREPPPLQLPRLRIRRQLIEIHL